MRSKAESKEGRSMKAIPKFPVEYWNIANPRKDLAPRTLKKTYASKSSAGWLVDQQEWGESSPIAMSMAPMVPMQDGSDLSKSRKQPYFPVHAVAKYRYLFAICHTCRNDLQHLERSQNQSFPVGKI